MGRLIRRIGGVLVVMAVGGALFAWSGIYNVAATKGHWPVVAWFLHFTMRQSVETHALTLTAPNLSGDALIERGAAHYQGGCAPCHGAPGTPGDVAARQMLPTPPDLAGKIGDWTPEQLFWIVRHGLKYTGMPAWPAPQREDEVWAVTAFLLRLPGMEEDEYRRLAFWAGPMREPSGPMEPADTARPLADLGVPPEPADADLLRACQRCHGADGAGRPSGAFPRLDIQSADYLAAALRDYATGLRGSGIMEPLAAALDETESRRLAAYFAQAGGPAPGSAPAPSPPGDRELGERLARTGIPDRQIAPCGTCHGIEGAPSDPAYPVLAGQFPGYIADQLRLWRSGQRGGSRASIMTPIAASLTDAEIEAVAQFYASLRPLPAP